MKRTGNISVDRQWLSNLGLLWTVVTSDAQRGFHLTTLSLKISQVLSGMCLWTSVVHDGFGFLNYLTEEWLLVVYVLFCNCKFQCHYLLERMGMWFQSYGQNWFHHMQDWTVRYFQYCFNIMLCEPMRKINCYHNNLYIYIYTYIYIYIYKLCIRVTDLELTEYRLERLISLKTVTLFCLGRGTISLSYWMHVGLMIQPSQTKVLTGGGDLREVQVSAPLSDSHSCVWQHSWAK